VTGYLELELFGVRLPGNAEPEIGPGLNTALAPITRPASPLAAYISYSGPIN